MKNSSTSTIPQETEEAASNASREEYQMLFHNHPLPAYILNSENDIIMQVNRAALQQYGYTREEFLHLCAKDLFAAEEAEKYNDYLNQPVQIKPAQENIRLHQKKDKRIFFAEVSSVQVQYQNLNAELIIITDCTEQIKAQEDLIKVNEKNINNEPYLFLSKACIDATWDWDLKTDEVQWGDGLKKMFQTEDLSMIQQMNQWLDHLHQEDKDKVKNKLNNYFAQKLPHWEDEYRFKTEDNAYKYISARGYIIYDDNDTAVRMIGALQDLTERKSHEDMLEQLNVDLEKRARELSESNAELERFAYVTSHDLQEPLRMVTSFLQLLEKRYKDKLDNKAHEYISFAVDGAERMKKLILDLLEYSRVNASVIEKENVDINEIIYDLRLTYKSLLFETKGTINNNKLPLVKGNKTQILQLFQNLIGNAFKYKSDKPPVIDITYRDDSDNYTFAVADNGIGIDAKFFQKIFIIFQRLHKREEYSGTGIGLAICKKIIDKHEGEIWVTSTPGKGSTFYFTLPKISKKL